MKIGKYPVKHSYRVARIVADVLSLGLVVLIVSSALNFMVDYVELYSRIDTTNETAMQTMLQNDPNYQWKHLLVLIFPALAVIVPVVYAVLVLKSHKLSRYDINKRNAQQCYDAYAFGVSLIKLPALMIVFDFMCTFSYKVILPVDGVSWFSWLTVLCALIIAIIVRYTMHRLEAITRKPAAVKSDAVKVKAVVSSKKPEKKADTSAENGEEKACEKAENTNENEEEI